MKYHFSSPRGPRLRRFFKRSPMDTGYDDRLPAEADSAYFATNPVFQQGSTIF
jgi:hypothetical protein